MITVTHTKVAEETFGLIELDLYFRGMQVMVKVSPNMNSDRSEHLRKSINEEIANHMDGMFTWRKE